MAKLNPDKVIVFLALVGAIGLVAALAWFCVDVLRFTL